MPNALDLYRRGYEKGRADNLADNVGEAVFGLLRDDPSGSFAAGYRDGAAGRKFCPPPDENEDSSTLPLPVGSTASELERAWYRLCNSSGFIPDGIVKQYICALQSSSESGSVAIAVGLSNFASYTCPRCGACGYFKIHFLGRLYHAGQCGWAGYLALGSYMAFQFRQIIHSGVRFGGSMKADAETKADRSGGWIYGITGFLFATIFRAAATIVLVPIHIIVAVWQKHKTTAQMVSRIAQLAVLLTLSAVGVYEIRQNLSGFHGPRDVQIVHRPSHLPASSIQPSPDANRVADDQHRTELSENMIWWLSNKEQGDQQALQLLSNGADPNYHGREGSCDNPLGLAVKFRYPMTFHALLQRGAAVNYQCPDEPSALGYAVQNGDLTMVRVLLERGASVAPYMSNTAEQALTNVRERIEDLNNGRNPYGDKMANLQQQYSNWQQVLASIAPQTTSSKRSDVSDNSPQTSDAPTRPIELTPKFAKVVLSTTFSTPDYLGNWTYDVLSGNPEVRHTEEGIEIHAPVSGALNRFIAKAASAGDQDVTFVFNHRGYGRTSVGLWSFELNDWQAWADLDTNDTPCLYLNSRGQPAVSFCPSDTYLNRSLQVRIQAERNEVTFYVDHAIVKTLRFSANGPYAAAFAVGSVRWKSGDNSPHFAASL
ncbi:MAG TPA: ankyrin repeat domain-containing protein [Candidatus Angelobacter sp.]